MTTAFENIAAGLADAIAFAKGDTSRGHVVAGPDVKPVRSTSRGDAEHQSPARAPKATKGHPVGDLMLIATRSRPEDNEALALIEKGMG